MKKRYNVIELFSGAGGLALGLHKAGFEPLLLVDFFEDANNTVRTNFPDWNVLTEDINILADKGIESYLKFDEIDLLSGGFPCQPFSYAGKKIGLEDTRGTVFYSLASIIDSVKPKVFLLENVRGLLSHDKGRTFSTIKNILSELGYYIDYKVLNAWDFGVAQKRERIFIVGTRKDYSIEFEWPEKHDYRPVLRDVLIDVPESEGQQYSVMKKSVLELVPPGGSWVDLPEDIAKEYMGKSFYSGGGKRGMARRISWDEPSLTLTCSPAQKQTERCHPDETRPFTIREYARIQSFPDEYKFVGSVSSQYQQIGNAVPVELAYQMGRSVYQLIEKIYEMEESHEDLGHGLYNKRRIQISFEDLFQSNR